MTTIMPKEKKVRDALQWVGEQTAAGKDRKKALQEAIFKYNLDPKQEDYLYRLFADHSQSE
ncbi:MAG: hypothetical protein R6U55_14645 [Desulfovermiculus sp.]